MSKVFPLPRKSLLALGLMGALAGFQAEAADATQPRAVAVDVVKLVQQPIEITTKLPGRTSAYRVAEVRPQVAGIVIKRLFKEGSLVKKGDVLYQIDPSTYQTTLDSAKASLASAQASLDKSKLQADRYADLVKKRAISEQDYEDAQATYRAAQANVMSAEASVKSAQIDLGYTKIKAPISGRIGKSYISEGALVTANQTTYLSTIQQLDPLYVDLSQSSSAVIKMRLQTQGENQKVSGIKVTLDDGTPITQEASLQFSDVTVNESTGTVALRALLPNPNNLLLPGLFVRAEVPVDSRENAILVPQAAVTRDAKGDAHVKVVNSENKIEDRIIMPDQIVGKNWLINSGIRAGESVVVSGLQKIKVGSLVAPTIKNQ
jgi:membrane fusion protein, multidrug efflux system